MEIQRPWLIQIEPVLGCNLKCDFCGNVSLPDGGKKLHFMSLKTFGNIVNDISQFGDKMRVAFAMRGEPTLHPKIITFTKYLKTMIPKAQISIISNGIQINREFAKRFFDVGGNILSIDCYGNSYNRHEQEYNNPNADWKTYNYRDFNIWQYHNPNIKIVSLIPDLREDNANTRAFTNQCDCISDKAYEKYKIERPVKGGLNKKCANPFRELSIRWNGDVMVCCKDWVSEERVLCNINDDGSAYATWYLSERLEIIRKLLLNNCRDFHPCNKCTYFGGFRQGFLPTTDKLDQKQMNKLIKRLNFLSKSIREHRRKVIKIN